MSAKNVITLLSLFFLSLFATCCGSVQAAAPPASPVMMQATAACTAEHFYDGATSGPIENPDYLQFASHACLITTAADGTPAQDVLESYTLKFDHTVQLANLEGGSNTGSEFEWAFWVDFKLPSGRSFSLSQQFDKHTDYRGNQQPWIPFSVPIHLPTGTVVTIRRPMLPDSYCTQAGPWAGTKGCATGQKIELVGTMQ